MAHIIFRGMPCMPDNWLCGFGGLALLRLAFHKLSQAFLVPFTSWSRSSRTENRGSEDSGPDRNKEVLSLQTEQ